MKERRRLPTISADGGAVVAGAASPAAKPRAGSATAHCGGRSVRVLMSRRQRPADWRCRCSEPCRSSSTRFKTAHLTCQGSVARVHSQFASLRKHRISALGRVPGSYFEIISDPVELDRALISLNAIIPNYYKIWPMACHGSTCNRTRGEIHHRRAPVARVATSLHMLSIFTIFVAFAGQ